MMLILCLWMGVDRCFCLIAMVRFESAACRIRSEAQNGQESLEAGRFRELRRRRRSRE